MNDVSSQKAINPSDVRYIKLGRAGKWVDRCLEQGEIHFGFKEAPHDMALRGNFAELKALYLGQGHSLGAASRFAREILEFYTLPRTTLWITFAHRFLWWSFAESEVIALGGDGSEHGSRMRRTVDGWRCVDARGQELRADALSSWLTKTAAYRATVCKVEARDYLLRRLNAEEEPSVFAGEAALRQLMAAVEALVGSLHWRDFEVLIDLLFARSGWQRISVLGQDMAAIDLIVEQPATRERGVVQVKSQAFQAELDEFWLAVKDGGFDRHWLVVHRGGDKLVPPNQMVTVWTMTRVAEAVVRLGLADWLLDRSR